MNLYDIASERQEEISSAIESSQKAATASTALGILLKALNGVREEIAEIAVDDVSVNNLDEVRASLRNELNRVSKPIINAINKLGLSKEKEKAVRAEIEAANSMALEASHDIQIIKKPKTRFSIENLSDIQIPETVSINNLSELQKYFDDLSMVVKEALNINLPAPQVSVQAPEINIPQAPDVNIDLEPLLKALGPLKFISDKPNKPISVRISSKDGKRFLNVLEEIKQESQRQVQAFSSGLNEASARKAFKTAMTSSWLSQSVGDGTKSVTTAGTRVQLSTGTSCKWVKVIALAANTGTIWVGGSSVANGRGEPLVAQQSTDRFEVDNLNKVYIDSTVNGEGVSFIYGS